jgi:hypothetical protein
MNWSADASTGKIDKASETGLMGTINGFTFGPDLDAGVFTSSGKELYPKKLNISFSFTVLHNHSLGWSQGEKTLEPRSSMFPYTKTIQNDSSVESKSAFNSVISTIQEAEVPNESQAEAIRRRLVQGFERDFDASQVLRRGHARNAARDKKNITKQEAIRRSRQGPAK